MCLLSVARLALAAAFTAPSSRVPSRAARSAPPVALDASLPKVVVFDLDGCLWSPDMYMLWGGGAPFTPRADGDLSDASGRRVHLLGDVRRILFELKAEERWQGVVVAVASRTDEPAWARECMQKFEVGPRGSGVFLADCIAVEEISKGNKQKHFKRIAETTGVRLEEMLFFDNERENCLDVAALGVTVAWTPEGVTAGAWEQSLARFPEPGAIFDFRRSG
ncbi:hypothetical protein AB1Y20_010832 [Prymnesium parvum]|uniref:Magnesium-dependent phosphatase-1 n=1 Tax=Prymnesium parvum TaxID=97485 RepID=A0AB34IPW6_PRYPA